MRGTHITRLAFSAISMLLLLAVLLPPGRVANAATTFNNPVLNNAPDPYVMRHTDGNYYFMSTTGNNLLLRRASSLTGIAGGTARVIYTPPGSGAGCCELWAPEIHYLDNKWYVYFTASSGGGDSTRRIYALENSSADPMSGSWVNRGALNTVVAGLDGTVWTHAGIRYFVYAGYGNWPAYGEAVYIAKMSNPWTLTGSQVVLTQPTAAWELVGGMAINEGPSFLEHGSKMYLVFSAGACWSDDYSLGMLSANATSDPLVKASWAKSAGPVFAKGNGIYAVGHNSFVKSPNGAEDWLVYHGNPGAGQGCDTQRSTRVQKISWNGDTPVFGAPQVSNISRPAGEPNDAGTYVQLINRNSGKCLDVQNPNMDAGANVGQWACNGQAWQRWQLIDLGNGYYRIASQNSSRVLDVNACSTADGGNVQQWTWLNNNCQQWQKVTTTAPWFRLVNRNSGKVLDVNACSTADGANVQQWTWLNNNCQQFQAVP